MGAPCKFVSVQENISPYFPISHREYLILILSGYILTHTHSVFFLIPGTLPVLINLIEFCEGPHILEITIQNEDGFYFSNRIEFQGGLRG